MITCLYCPHIVRNPKEILAHWIEKHTGGKHGRPATEATGAHQGALPPPR